MTEEERLRELSKYSILDTPPEKELDELAQIASAIFNTPISLVSLVDEKRQWFKAKVGIDVEETPRQYSFCQHALHTPNEVLVVNDALDDERFRNNPMVVGEPNIRFYAGAPLETPQGAVLGTVCIIDDKPRDLPEIQKKALQLLAKRAMDLLEKRRLIIEQANKIESDAVRLKKLTDYVPGVIFQFEINESGRMSFSFVSKGITKVHRKLTPELLEASPNHFFTVIHPDDIAHVQGSINEALRDKNVWKVEFRIISEEEKTTWHFVDSVLERNKDGAITWYGMLQDVTERKEYARTLEQILFDISHVLRKPIANMVNLVTIIQDYGLDEETQKEYMSMLKAVSDELDIYTRQLNDDYHLLREKNKGGR
ncbi:GAF domain-containing protein [Telluribacter sp. SYSU D00476]|uniref:GAF domain-containing protein n=1 Tax=Telluribacter sp. SYSU D00476 TaxID=2811430 RepID=UPI001FF2AD1C|nr:GAF domain-containing protein [Telluribacter sp. SYSU D00476]